MNQSEYVKGYYLGNILFRRLTEDKRVIDVLQVSPYSSYELSDYNANKKTNLAQNEKFMALLKDLKDYDINIEVISADDF